MANFAKEHHERIQSQSDYDSPPSDDMYADVLGNLTSQLTTQEKGELARRISVETIRNILRVLPTGKAPGPDGLPHELWKTLNSSFHTKHKRPFFDIATALTLVYNDIEQYGVNPDSTFATAWMAHIPKKGDLTDLNNHCPITVLNKDYKIMTSALTFNLSKAISNLIHTDQAGFTNTTRD